MRFVNENYKINSEWNAPNVGTLGTIAMAEKNPLQTSYEPSLLGKFLNKRGRPTTEKAIKFAPQPRSIVSQMLQKIKTENVNMSYDTPEPTVCIANDSNELEEVEAKDTCKVNSYRSDSPKELEKHVPAKHACDYPECSYSCKLFSNLIKHKRIHTGEKPYLCDRCSFRSNFINSLKTHKRIHTSERPYQCSHCSYKCNSSSNLKKHCFHRHPEISSN